MVSVWQASPTYPFEIVGFNRESRGNLGVVNIDVDDGNTLPLILTQSNPANKSETSDMERKAWCYCMYRRLEDDVFTFFNESFS